MSPKSWKAPQKPVLSADDLAWKAQIIDILADDAPCYGYRKVAGAFKRKGVRINRKKVARIMRLTGLAQKRRKRTIKTTDSRHALPTYPNLVKDIVPAFPHHIWISDITCVRLAKGFCYVAIVRDVFTRKVVGFAVMETMETVLVTTALTMALEHGTPMYHHSDRGGQYCSHDYTGMLKAHDVAISMAETGVSVDNPFAESFNKTLKVEEVYLSDYRTIEDARTSITRFIERVYNEKRLHASLGYVPPAEFEAAWLRENQSSVPLLT
jgi:putative transposase